MRRLVLAAVFVLLTGTAGTAIAKKRIEALDADTVRFNGGGALAVITLRLRFIDAPESNSSCLAERNHSKAAVNRINDLLAKGGTPSTEFEFDRYGRFLGDVTLPEPVRIGPDALSDVAEILARQAYVRRWDGKGARRPWCDAEGRLTP